LLGGAPQLKVACKGAAQVAEGEDGLKACKTKKGKGPAAG